LQKLDEDLGSNKKSPVIISKIMQAKLQMSAAEQYGIPIIVSGDQY